VRGVVVEFGRGLRLEHGPGEQRFVGSGRVVGVGRGHGHQERRGIVADGVREVPSLGRAAAE